MPDKKLSYWERRALDREKSYQEGSDKTLEEIQRVYDRAFDDIERRIKQLDKKIKTEADPETAESLLKRSYELQQMERGIYETFAQAAQIEKRVTTSRYAALMEQAYYFATFDIQKGLGFAYGFNIIPKRAITAALNAYWLNHNYSESIWKNSAKAAMAASDIVISGLASGRSNEDMSAELAEVMHAGMTAARRLMRTETNYFSNQGELEAYKEAGLERYRFLATLDSVTSKMCRAHDGLIDPDTGQEYLVSNAQAGINYPPLHAWCRSTTVIVIDNDAKAGLRTRRAKDPVTGKYYTVPQDMTYNEWYDQHVKGNSEAEFSFKAASNEHYDRVQFEKYHAIFGNEIGENLADFQNMKYNRVEDWESLKARKQEALNALEYRPEFLHRFGNLETRLWYIAHDEQIVSLIDHSLPLEEQAAKAHGLRNMYRTQARDMMQDQILRVDYDKRSPNWGFEQLLADKMERKGMTRLEALHDIIKTSGKTNKDVNKALGLGD